MTYSLRQLIAAAALVPALAATAAAQQTAPLMADLLTDVKQVEEKLVGLAKAIGADKYEWRPAAGVRSVAEVMMHVAADNYLFPAAIGIPADPATGIKGDDYKTAVAFEQRKLSRDAIISELEKSFAHLKTAMQGTQADALGKQIQMFGMSFTGQQAWIIATTHLHEHLGQAIAYARSNGVVPPWSR